MIYKKCFALLAASVLSCSAYESPQNLEQNPAEPVSIQRRFVPAINNHGTSGRRMVAARSLAGLEKRQEGFEGFLKQKNVLHFVDDASEDRAGGRPSLGCEVHAKSKLPTLLLEDTDSYTERIACTGSQVEVDFNDQAAVEAAWLELQQQPQILLVTSHPGCNAVGERKPFIVHDVRRRELSLTFSVISTSWRESFHSIDVHFNGEHGSDRLQKRDVQKREAATSASGSTETSSSVNFPPPPSSSPTITSVHDAHIDASFQDTSILPPKFPGIDGATLHGPLIPQGLTVTCKDCSIGGDIDLVRGTFSTSDPSDSNTTMGIVDFYDDGFVEMTVNNFAAHIELESTVTASPSITQFTAPFPDIGIPGFTIPGIASVGPVLRPRVTFGVEVATELDFTYGIDLKIPNNSTVQLNIKNATASTITGFAQTNITALPFQAQVGGLNLTAFIAFEPQLLLTISIFEDVGSISVGAFLDLPRLTAQIAQIASGTADCEPPPGSNSSSTTSQADDKPIFQDLTLINPSVALDVGVLADAELSAGAFNVDDRAVYTAFSTAFPLPTACLSFDAAQKTFGPPVAASTASTSAVAGGKDKKSAAAAGPVVEGPGGAAASSVLALAAAVGVWGMVLA